MLIVLIFAHDKVLTTKFATINNTKTPGGSAPFIASTHLADCQSRAPLVLQNVEADTSIGIDIAVIDSCGKANLRRLEGVVGGEMNRQKIHPSSIRTLIRSHYSRLPVEQIISHRACRAIRWGVSPQVLQLFIDSTGGVRGRDGGRRGD